jgi:hypothetical protein
MMDATYTTPDHPGHLNLYRLPSGNRSQLHAKNPRPNHL